MKTLDIFCPLCGASKGARCWDVRNHSYLIDRPHRERVIAAKAISGDQHIHPTVVGPTGPPISTPGGVTSTR